ncbi:MAG: hypothetical protein LUQ38_00065 [Methanotrichaceae archaeon]|nr:hypothetical protein [Methanotrichaceae archaeon]
MTKEDGGDVPCRVLAEGKVRRAEIRSVDVEPWKEAEMDKVVDSASVTALEEFFVEQSVFTKILAEIQEDSFVTLR